MPFDYLDTKPASKFEYLDTQSQQQPQPDTSGSFPEARAAIKNLVTTPMKIAKSLTPEKMSEQAPVLGAVGGEMLAGPAGAAIGAGTGQIVKRIADLAYGRVQPGAAMNPAKEAVAPMIQSATAGLPGTTQWQAVTKVIGKGLAKAGQAFSGTRADVLQQAAKQGYSTYGAPSLAKAQDVFAEALGPEGQQAMKQTASQAFDPALGQARALATDIGTRLEGGETISAIDALKARQATDRVISATPFWDAKARQALFDWRNTFDEVIKTQGGPLKEASSTYRKAIVKDAILKPLPVNKHGEYSRLAPMLASLAGGVGGVGGHDARGGALGTAGYLLGTSPLAMGAAATTLGAINPVVRQAALAAFIDKVTTK